MGSRDFPNERLLHLISAFCQHLKMSDFEAQDAFIIFDEAYEGADIDAFYLGDVLRALGCNCTNATVIANGGQESIGVKRITFDEFLPVLKKIKADTIATGVKEDYIEGLKVFDKEGTGKVALSEVANTLCSLGEKLESNEATTLFKLLDIKEDEEGLVGYMELIDKLIAACS